MLQSSEIANRKAGGEKPRARRVNDACSALGVSRSHIYALAAKGELRLVKVGGRTLVPEAEIDRLLGEAA